MKSKFLLLFIMILFSCGHLDRINKERKVISDFFDCVSNGKFKTAESMILIKDEISLSNENMLLLQQILSNDCKNQLIDDLKKIKGVSKIIEGINLSAVVYEVSMPVNCYDTAMYPNLRCSFAFEQNEKGTTITYFSLIKDQNLFKVPTTPVKIRKIFDENDSL